MQEYQNVKTFLWNATFQSDQKFFLTKKAKNTLWWTYIVNDLIGEDIFGLF